MTVLTLPVAAPNGTLTAHVRSAFAVERTDNGKLSIGKKFSTTLSSHHSCPDTCRFKGDPLNPDGPNGNGCFTYDHLLGNEARKLDRAGETDFVKIALQEAAAIDALTGKWDCRIHEVGDCSCIEAAQIVAAAAERYMAKQGRIAFTYTHAYKAPYSVPRSAWGNVSVLGSCETEEDIQLVQSMGYVPSIVVSEFLHDTPYYIGGHKFLPCPHNLNVQVTNEKGEKEHITCRTCRFCLKESWLREKGLGVAFRAHGSRVKTARSVLQF